MASSEASSDTGSESPNPESELLETERELAAGTSQTL